MKKIIYLLLVLMLVMLSICACDTNTEDLENINSNMENQSSNIEKNNSNIDNQNSKLEKDNSNIDSQNNELTNQENATKNLNEEKSEDKEEIINLEPMDSNQTISVSASSLSNKKCAWGFVRQKNEVRPQFSADYTKVLDDYKGIYAGNSEQKVIYLTFDEGYENGYTGAILDTLKEKNCPATFFVTKPYVKQNQELVKRMIDEGHIVRESHRTDIRPCQRLQMIQN